jgi:hypothetical protein
MEEDPRTPEVNVLSEGARSAILSGHSQHRCHDYHMFFSTLHQRVSTNPMFRLLTPIVALYNGCYDMQPERQLAPAPLCCHPGWRGGCARCRQCVKICSTWHVARVDTETVLVLEAH